jgi:hypothetical protein
MAWWSVKKAQGQLYLYFIEPEGSLPCSQQLDTCPYPEPDESSPHMHSYNKEINFGYLVHQLHGTRQDLIASRLRIRCNVSLFELRRSPLRHYWVSRSRERKHCIGFQMATIWLLGRHDNAVCRGWQWMAIRSMTYWPTTSADGRAPPLRMRRLTFTLHLSISTLTWLFFFLPDSLTFMRFFFYCPPIYLHFLFRGPVTSRQSCAHDRIGGHSRHSCWYRVLAFNSFISMQQVSYVSFLKLLNGFRLNLVFTFYTVKWRSDFGKRQK